METGSIKFLQWYYVPKAYMYMCMGCYRRIWCAWDDWTSILLPSFIFLHQYKKCLF